VTVLGRTLIAVVLTLAAVEAGSFGGRRPDAALGSVASSAGGVEASNSGVEPPHPDKDKPEPKRPNILFLDNACWSVELM
jgi:hypothetical protein